MASAMIPSGPWDPTYWGLGALALFVILVKQTAWVYSDARRMGHDPRLSVLFFLFLWPLSLPIWFLARSGRHFAPDGHGSGWG